MCIINLKYKFKMRKIITILSVSIVLVACSSNANQKSKSGQSKSDTSIVLAVYKIDKNWKMDSVFRITKDTFRIATIDTTDSEAKIQRIKDTAYFLPVVIDSVNKKVRWYGFPPKFVQEVKAETISLLPPKQG